MNVKRPVVMLVTAVLAAVVFPAVALAAPAGGAGSSSYIVVLKDDASVASTSAVDKVAGHLASAKGGKVGHVYSAALKGFSVTLTPAAAKSLAKDPAIASVEADGVVRVRATATQLNAPWHLDRIDQVRRPLNGQYVYPRTASNVTAYVLDSGVRMTHAQFGGRARSGWDFVDNDSNASDCAGHGTHVAGLVGGSTYGVAKQVKIVSVRVLNCYIEGQWSQILAGVDWVTRNAVRPAVVNMSLGGAAGSGSLALEAAIRNSIASGLTYVLAAGNDSTDACRTTPARVSEGITVGATNSSDARAWFSNYGTCVDIFAPGDKVRSASKAGDTAWMTMSGTSMASPIVAGAAALVLSANPSLTPAQVRSKLAANAAYGVLTNTGTGSPNRLLNVQAL